MSVLLSTEILRVKLADWVLSSHIGEVLALKEEDEAAAKKQLEALAEKGIIERDGQRRGLKYRFNKEFVDSSDASSEEVESTKPFKAADAPTLNIELFERQRTADYEKAKIKANVTTLTGLMTSLVKSSPSSDAGIMSYTLSMKKTHEGAFIVRLYSGLAPVHEVSLSKDKFIKFITESGVTLHE